MFAKKRFIWLCLIIFLAFSRDASSSLINEILANGLSDPEHEWVELFNNGTEILNITNWKISETSSSNFTFNATVSAKSFIILAPDFGIFNSTYPYVSASGISIIEITVSNFNLADSGGEVRLYNSSGALVDSIRYVQSSGKAFENISIGRYPDGSASIFNISTLTPGAKNDNQAPKLNKWLNPGRNNTNISGITLITVNLTDDATQVNFSLINFNGTNFSMERNGDLWTFLWNTSKNPQKSYNITIFFNDSYGKLSKDRLLNILVNNSPRIDSFSPVGLVQSAPENSTLNFSVKASDPDSIFDFFWYIDGVLASNSPNFSYSPSLKDNGTHVINVTLKDLDSQASMKWTVVVTNLNRPPTFEIATKNFTKNVNSSLNITFSDPDNDPLSFKSNKSAIAISKINNSFALFSWKPTNLELGSNIINLTASDGSLSESKIITLVVNPNGNKAPVINPLTQTTAIINEQNSYDIEAPDADNDTIFFSIKTNATGISIDSATGLISFKPASLGFFSVNVSASDLLAITNQTFFISSEYGTRLKIKDIDVQIDGKKSSNLKNESLIGKEAMPLSEIEFKIKVKNDFSREEGIDIEDISVKATIEEIDNGDDIELEPSSFDLRPENDKILTLKFDVPLSVDEDIFDVLIEAEGEDENGQEHGQFLKLKLEVEKQEHDLRFLDFNAYPKDCGSIAVDFRIINAGSRDEKNAALEIRADSVTIMDERFDVAAPDNSYSGSSIFKTENIESLIVASLYSSDGKLQATKTASVEMRQCRKAVKQPLFSGINSEADSRSLKALTDDESHDGMLMIVLSTFMMSIFFLFVAIILFIKG